MPYTCDRPLFSVNVTSGFISDWQWAVHAVAEYRSVGTVGIRKDVEVEAQLALMTGISRESREGRERGARSVVVLVEGDREIAGRFKGLHQTYGAPAVALPPLPGNAAGSSGDDGRRRGRVVL